ncbi:rhomboid family protein [Flavobacterium silvaticum]|uniref:Rhomboid family intramembrane serine protease n=1 Tax=Flavobacterium silvaticum TaxID=1852020 RepID=A0A972FVC1_9FLAO|nr:rhomboid family intramembrane serine protease [Flavobacterium silvaticum]NMH29363.1 rhomboid family intramembrane serine protease [Flavobacterium silvaticum]
MATLLDDIKRGYRTGGPEMRLIYMNVAAFVLSLVFFYQWKSAYFDYPDWLALSSDFAVSFTHPWTYITYAFLHASFFHLFFNMLVLQFAGVLFGTFFNPKQFYGLYLLSAIFSGLVYNISFLVLGHSNIMVGASAAIMSILVATATYSPNMRISLFFIGQVKLWIFASVLLFIDFLYLFADNTGGHIAHLAGAIFGFVYVKMLKSGTDLSRPITWLFDFIANGFRPQQKAKFKKVHRNPKPEPRPQSSEPKDKTQQQIDEILDKISRSGYDSLSKEERDFLFRAGNDK